jgi:hypothetical protein
MVIVVLAAATECSSHVALDLPKSIPAAASARDAAWGHPLAGRSSRYRLSRGEEFSFHPLLSNSSTFDRLNYAPLFSVGRCRTLGPHQSPIRFKALGDFSKENFIPPLANFVAPENCRYHAVSKVNRITDPLAHPCGRPTQMWLTTWAYHLIKSSPSCLSLGTGQPLIRPRGFQPTPMRAHCPVPTVSVLCQANALVTSNATWSFIM